MIYASIILTLCFIALGFIAFFLMAIWRAILGKSSVDVKLGVGIDLNSKKMDALNKTIGTNTNTLGNLKTELRDIKRLIRKETTNEA